MSIAQFVWYDVMTTDCRAAEQFYRDVIGWNTVDSGVPDRTYILLSAGSTMVGGLMPIPDEAEAAGAKPAWMGYVGVSDVDAYAKRVVVAGGTLHRPPENIPGVGRFAVAADPHGAGFILFKGSSDEAPAPAAPLTLGHIGWHELHAGNGPEAFDFYSKLFGWTKSEAIPMGDHGVYQLFAAGGSDIGGMMTKMAQSPAPFWLYYFNVDAIDAASARATKAGGQIINGPMEVPGGMWVVQCLDPQGAMFAMVANTR